VVLVDPFPPHVESGAIEPVAAVDVDPVVWTNTQAGLSLPEERCFEGAATAKTSTETSTSTPARAHGSLL
jgi:hypothetical protein